MEGRGGKELMGALMFAIEMQTINRRYKEAHHTGVL